MKYYFGLIAMLTGLFFTACTDDDMPDISDKINKTFDMPDASAFIEGTALNYFSNTPERVLPGNIDAFGATCLGSRIFEGQDGLYHGIMIFDKPVTSIGSNAFKGAGNLASIALPNTVTSIGSYAFEGTAVDFLEVPKAVTRIKKNAFLGSSLCQIDFRSEQVPVLEDIEHSFPVGNPDFIIYPPYGKENDYIEAWQPLSNNLYHPAYKLSQKEWMRSMPNHMLLRDMVIPGTHDSGTFAATQPACDQSLNFEQQFNIGVRAFDLRVNAVKDNPELYIFHGPFPCLLNFEDVVDEIYKLVVHNNSEFAFIIVKRESDLPLSSAPIIYKNIQTIENKFAKKYPNNTGVFKPNLTVGDARGKVFFISRAEEFPDKSMPLIGCIGKDWDDHGGRPDIFSAIGKDGDSVHVSLMIQDKYCVGEHLDKQEAARIKMENHFKPRLKIYQDSIKANEKCDLIGIQHLSAYHYVLDSHIAMIADFDRAINPLAAKYLESIANTSGPMGFVMMDRVGDPAFSGDRLMNAVMDIAYRLAKKYPAPDPGPGPTPGPDPDWE